jgi:hypothetical protein
VSQPRRELELVATNQGGRAPRKRPRPVTEGIASMQDQPTCRDCGIHISTRSKSGRCRSCAPRNVPGQLARNTLHRRAQRDFAATACNRCGTTDKLVRHHKDENPANNVPENIEILCRACHARHHLAGKPLEGKTHCKNGHPWIPENWMTWGRKRDGQPTRRCRICENERRARRLAA